MLRPRLAALTWLLMVLCPPRALAENPQAWLDAAIRRDLDGTGSTSIAFADYLRAARAGLPEAEFDVAVMLDSGRGVDRDIAAAAAWYARAAAHADRRAAFNLGQLYEAGEGVPRNPDLARAWYEASDLAAARMRIASMEKRVPAAASTPPDPSSPVDGAEVGAEPRIVELVWTSGPQPEPADYFVELRKIDIAGSREVFSVFTRTSSVLAPVSGSRGDRYAWRVSALARRAGDYASSGWSSFVVGPGGPNVARPSLSARRSAE